MISDLHARALARASELWKITPDYWDIWGNRHVTAPETVRALLEGMGIPAGSAPEVERAIDERLRREWLRLLPPCVVADLEQGPPLLYVNAPAELADASVRLTIQREVGETLRQEIHLGRIPAKESAEFDGRTYVRKEFHLEAQLPLGYHEVHAALGEAGDSMRLILTPARAWEHPALAGGGRAAGIAVALYGLRSARNWGCGDLRDLRGVVDWAAGEAGGSFIALNPLHAIPNRRPFNTSPYLPASIFYQNFIYLDLEAIEDFTDSARAARLWNSPQTRAEVEALRGSEYVEYERVARLKLCFLKQAFLQFRREARAGSPRQREFQDFIEREGDLLERFALYCALDEYLRARHPDLWVWPEWPEPYRDPDSAETRDFRRRHWRSVQFYQYVQWQLDRQLAAAQQYARERGLSIGLYHDLALATDRCGSDLWAHRRFYVSGCRVGSPPDDFSPKGQDWAFPPPRSEMHRETGYRLFVESLRKNCRHGGALRIDHVMRFFRLFWIPEGAAASEGAYVRDRYEDLVRILALESVRNRVVIIGEDLGTVEPFVRETLSRFRILSYRLFYFEKHENGEFKTHAEYPRKALVSSTTHDLPTLAGFWTNADIDARRRAGLFPNDEIYHQQLTERRREKQKMLDLLFRLNLLPDSFPRLADHVGELTGELHNAIIGFLASTPSALLLVNEEDLTKEAAQQNLPGTTWQYPNWSRKMKFTVEELRSAQAARDFTAMFRNWLARTGRLNRD